MARNKRRLLKRTPTELPEHIPAKVELDFVGNTCELMEHMQKTFVKCAVAAWEELSGSENPTT